MRTLSLMLMAAVLCGGVARAKDKPVIPAVDGEGALWLADGNGCERDKSVRGSTYGSLWRSVDKGENWREVPVFTADGERMTGAAASVIAEKKGKRVLVRSESCCSEGSCEGGEAFTSEDGGKSWTMLVLDEMLPMDQVDDEGQGIIGVWWRGTTLEQFVVEVGGHGAFATADGGAVWTKVKEGTGEPSFRRMLGPDDGLGAVEIGVCEFRASGEGLTRKCGEGKGVLVFPNEFVRQGPLLFLTRLAGCIVAARIVDATTGKTIAGFQPDEVMRINAVIKRGTRSDGWVATTPPWSNPIVLTAVTGEELPVHFVGTALRVNLLDPMQGGAGGGNPAWEANAADLDLDYDDGEWLWGLMGSVLGGTKVKEYKALPEEKGLLEGLGK